MLCNAVSVDLLAAFVASMLVIYLAIVLDTSAWRFTGDGDLLVLRASMLNAAATHVQVSPWCRSASPLRFLGNDTCVATAISILSTAPIDRVLSVDSDSDADAQGAITMVVGGSHRVFFKPCDLYTYDSNSNVQPGGELWRNEVRMFLLSRLVHTRTVRVGVVRRVHVDSLLAATDSEADRERLRDLVRRCGNGTHLTGAAMWWIDAPITHLSKVPTLMNAVAPSMHAMDIFLEDDTLLVHESYAQRVAGFPPLLREAFGDTLVLFYLGGCIKSGDNLHVVEPARDAFVHLDMDRCEFDRRFVSLDVYDPLFDGAPSAIAPHRASRRRYRLRHWCHFGAALRARFDTLNCAELAVSMSTSVSYSLERIDADSDEMALSLRFDEAERNVLRGRCEVVRAHLRRCAEEMKEN